jgi:hypothetical protein
MNDSPPPLPLSPVRAESEGGLDGGRDKGSPMRGASVEEKTETKVNSTW